MLPRHTKNIVFSILSASDFGKFIYYARIYLPDLVIETPIIESFGVYVLTHEDRIYTLVESKFDPRKKSCDWVNER